MNKNKTLFLSLVISLVIIIAGVVLFSVFGFNGDGTYKDKTVITVSGSTVMTTDDDFMGELKDVCKDALKDADAKVSSVAKLESTDSIKFEYTLRGSYNDAEITALVSAVKGAIDAKKTADNMYGQAFLKVNGHTLEGVNHYKYFWTFAISALVVAVVAFVYFVIRFNLSLSIAMGVACLHDVLLTWGFIALTRIPMGAGVAAVGALALLASVFVNGLVFEKMRRDFKTETKLNATDAVYASLKQTKNLVITTLALMLVVFAILAIVGIIVGLDLTFMMLGAIVAVIVVGYSSLVVCPALVAILKEKFDARKSAKAKYNYSSDKNEKQLSEESQS